MDGSRVVLPGGEVTPASRLLTLVGFVVVIAGLYLGRQVLIPLALGLVFAFLFSPIVGFLERCRLGRIPSVLVVMALSFALLAGVAWGVANQLIEIMVHLPDYRANIEDKIKSIRAPQAGALGKATAAVNDLSKELASAAETEGNRKAAKSTGKAPIAVQVAAPPRSPVEYLRNVLGPLTGVLEMALIVVIFTLFILMKREDLRNRLLRLAGSAQLNVMTQAMDDASKRLGRFLLLQFVVNAGYGLLFGLGVYFIGIPNPLLWGVLGGLLRFIPYIGTPVGALFPMAMALAVFPGWRHVGMTLGLFLILELTIANVVEPWLYGAHTGISSLAILVTAIFWGMLWGPVGLILSTPLTVCLILLGRYVPQLNFLEILLGDEPVLSPQAHFYQRLLALDDDEAKQIADKYLKENPLGHFYDEVLIPALSLAEQDRHMNALDESRTKFIHQSTRELMEELYEAAHAEGSASSKEDSAAALVGIAPASRPRIVCVPARDEADEIVGTMVMQLLRHAGHDAHALAIGSVATMLGQVEEFKPAIVCVSALPPFAAGQAKAVCKHLRQRCPQAKIILGLWEFPGGLAKAQERVGANCADMIGTSLAQVVTLIGAAEGPLASRAEVEVTA